MSALSISSTLKLNDGILIPRLGLGIYLTRDATPILHAFKTKYQHVDGAQLYANEAELGEAVRQSGIPRDQLFLTTKVWDTNHGYEKATKSIEKSLSVSGLDYWDLFLIHSPNPGKQKRLETWRALIDAKKQGKIRSIGVSNYGPHHIEELVEAYPNDIPSINQIELSPFFQRSEIVQACRKHNIAIEAYSPLGKGAHTDLPELKAIGDKYGKTPSQILIRWSLEKGFICLPKSANPKRIEENANIFDFELKKEDSQTLDALETGSGVTWDPTTAP
ncbi:unnamed protein product [Sympodiomycopsis kandeliae]